ncbi:hypothetical protein BKA56DRAFT_481621 [Ilyonectria sp. MPI-CAGE-AT-0026]|nr:hypothetical protein BKA56DRAFT_481621 [Ilyonectria sp. MPI-CAGE-AT-0026]
MGQSDLNRSPEQDESQNSSKRLQEELVSVPRAGWQFQNRLLSPRWAPTTEAYFTTKVLLGQIMAYPRMMAQGRRLPPFIFPRCAMDSLISQECATMGTHRCLPETLAICCSLAQSFESRTPASEAFVWRAINAEQARLRCECSTYDTNRLLEALQATTIYLLLHAQHLESVSSIDTLSLVQTMEEISKLLHSTFDYKSEPEEPSCLDRQAWVLVESVRRTICLLFGIELLLDVIFGPLARPHCGGYSHVPLPCVGDLWEPVSNVEWSKRFRDANPGGTRKTRLNIEVLKSSRQTLEADPAESWKECAAVPDVAHWCERVDELGMLVWMAVMLETRRSHV